MKNFNEVYEKIYNNHSSTILKKWNRLKIINIIWGITFSICLFIFFSDKYFKIFNEIKHYNIYVIGICSIGFLILFIINNRCSNNFNEIIISDLLKEYDESLNYNSKKGISYDTFIQSELAKTDKDNKFYSKNYISGILNNKNKIEFAYVNVYYFTHEYMGDTSFSVKNNKFNGLYINFELTQYINTPIKLRTNVFDLFKNSNLTDLTQKQHNFIREQDNFIREQESVIEEDRIQTKNVEFNKKFALFSNDLLLPLKIFDDEMIRKFLKLSERTQITPQLTVKGNHLFIGLPHFIYNEQLMKNPLDYKFLKKYYDIIFGTLDFALDLDKKISEVL